MSRCDLDLWPFDLESFLCIKCHVIKLSSLPHLSKIEQSAVELQRFKHLKFGAVRFFGFDRKWIFTISRPP